MNGDDDSVEEEMEEAEERDTNPTIVVKEEVVEPPKVRFILSGGKIHIPASRYLQNPPNVRNIMSQRITFDSEYFCYTVSIFNLFSKRQKTFLKTKEFNLSPTLIFAYCQGDGFVEQEVSNPAQDINLEVVSALSTPQTGKVTNEKLKPTVFIVSDLVSNVFAWFPNSVFSSALWIRIKGNEVCRKLAFFI